MSIEEIDHVVKMVEDRREPELSSFLTSLGKEESCMLVSAPSSKGFAAIHSAAFMGNLRILKLIVETGCNVNLPLTATVRRGVEWFEKDSTALHIACSKPHHDIVEYLIEAGAEVNRANGEMARQTSLHIVAESGHLQNADIILAKGAQMNVVDKTGDTPLHKASKMGHSSLIMLLHNNQADMNAANQLGQSALQLAVSEGHLKATIVLVENGADATARDSGGNGILAVSVLNEKEDITPLLLDNEVEIDAQNDEGESALHIASRLGQLSTVQLLLEVGANVNLQNFQSRTPLHIAAEQNQIFIVGELLGAGTDTSLTDVQGRLASQLTTQPDITELFVTHPEEPAPLEFPASQTPEELSAPEMSPPIESGDSENVPSEPEIIITAKEHRFPSESMEPQQPVYIEGVTHHPAPLPERHPAPPSGPPPARPASRLGQVSPRIIQQQQISPSQSFNTSNVAVPSFEHAPQYTPSFSQPIGIDKTTVDTLKKKLAALESQILTLSLGDDRAVVLFRQFGKLHEEIGMARMVVKDKISNSNRPLTPRMENTGKSKNMSLSELPTPSTPRKIAKGMKSSKRSFNPNFMVESAESLKSELQLIKSVVKPSHYNKLERYIEQVESFSLALVTFAHLLALNMR